MMMMWRTAVTMVSMLILVIVGARANYFHKDSFITDELSLNYMVHAFNASKLDPLGALEFLRTSYQYKPSLHSLEIAIMIKDLLGNLPTIGQWADIEASKNQAYLDNKNLMEEVYNVYRTQQYDVALSLLLPHIAVYPCAIAAVFQVALISKRLGRLADSQSLLEQTLECFPLHTQSIVNLASLYQVQNREHRLKAIDLYNFGIASLTKYRNVMGGFVYLNDDEFRMRGNLGLAYYQELLFEKALQSTQELIDILVSSINIVSSVSPPYDITTLQYYLQGAYGNQLIIARAALSWRDSEYRQYCVLAATLEQFRINYPLYNRTSSTNQSPYPSLTATKGPYLPFDSLLDDVSLPTRLIVAKKDILSHEYMYQYDVQSHFKTTTSSAAESSQPFRPTNLLKIALYSTDFNDHPTAQLVASLFFYIKRMKQLNMSSSWYQHIQLIVYDYGNPQDTSDYRRLFKTLADSFVETLYMDHTSFIRMVQREHIDVFLEMQVHTLLSRVETTILLAQQEHIRVLPTNNLPAAKESISSFVNYLVYPGTAGTTWLDHIISDSVVVPVEHTMWYSEKMLYLPATYQISTYTGLGLTEVPLAPSVFERDFKNVDSVKIMDRVEEEALPFVPQTKEEIQWLQTYYRRRFNLPLEDSAIVFANFNKIDKLDPESLSLWVQILQQIPNSYLWLLLPKEISPSSSDKHNHSNSDRNTSDSNSDRNTSDSNSDRNSFKSDHRSVVQRHLRDACAYHGIAFERRVIVAERMSKRLHIERHIAADVFLDTMIYSAHSTATDALRGGLPVMTMVGGAFANRVVSSLYHSFPPFSRPFSFDDMFATVSKKDFINWILTIFKTPSSAKIEILLNYKLQLWNYIQRRQGLFDEDEHARRLVVALSALKEEYYLFSNHGRNDIVNNHQNYRINKLKNRQYETLFSKNHTINENGGLVLAKKRRWHLIMRPYHV